MGLVKMSGVVPAVTAPVTFPAVFADATWAEIIEACERNRVPDTWTVGDQKTMNIDGTDYLIDIIGKHHDVYSDGSGTAPLTFQTHKIYAMSLRANSTNTNVGGWKDSEMRNTNLPTVLDVMPAEVRDGIKEVNKLTSAGNKSDSIDTTADKLFLLSEFEVYGQNTGTKSGEGLQYAYYAAGNSRVKEYSTLGAGFWLLRSPSATSSVNFCYVTDLDEVNAITPTSYMRTSFAFCF